LSATIPTLLREPQTIAAGDNVSWIRQIDDYPATVWTLHYVIRSTKNIYKFDAVQASASDVLFQVTLTTATTATWEPALYSIGAYVTSGTQQFQIHTFFQQLEVTANLAATPNGSDPRSFASKMLVEIETTIAKLTSKSVTTAQVNGQAYTLANLSELWKMRERFASEVRREEAKARLNAGLGGSNKIGIRFRPLNIRAYPWQQRVPWQ
jgi:hypothetical protein